MELSQEQIDKLAVQIVDKIKEKNSKGSDDAAMKAEINRMIAEHIKLEQEKAASAGRQTDAQGGDVEGVSKEFSELVTSKAFGIAIIKAAGQSKANINIAQAFEKYVGMKEDKFNAELAKVKAFDGGSGTGAEFIETRLSNEVFTRASRKQRIEPLLRHITMPSNPYNLPLDTALPAIYGLSGIGSGASATAIKDSQSTTGQNTITAIKIGGSTYVTADITEDSLIAAIPFVQDSLVSALGLARDYDIVRGDIVTAATGNINSDDAAPDNTVGQKDKYLEMDGMIKDTFTATYGKQKNVGTTLALTHFAQTAALMDDDAEIDNMVWILGNATYWAVVDLLQKPGDYGRAGTIENGRITSLFGIQCIKDERTMPLTDDDGKITTLAATNDQKCALLLDRMAYVVFDHRAVTIASEKKIATDQILFVGTTRFLSKNVYKTSTSVPGVVFLFNAD